MGFWLDLFVFGFVVLERLHGWAVWLRDPGAAERRRHHGHRVDAYAWMSADARRGIAAATFLMYAAWRADLWWLWSFGSTLALAVASVLIGRLGQAPPLDPTPLTSGQLDRLVDGRKKEALWMQAGLLAVWTYSWRHLFL